MQGNASDINIKTNSKTADTVKNGEAGFVYFRCPVKGCSGVFHEQHRSYYEKPLDQVKCPDCAGKGTPIYFSEAGDENGKLYIQFICESCNEEFEKLVLASRVRCDKCKQFRNIYWAFLAQFPF